LLSVIEVDVLLFRPFVGVYLSLQLVDIY